MEQMKNLHSFLPFVIALLCAGFASTQDVFMGVTDWLGALSMKLNYGWFTILLIVLFTTLCCYLLKINWRKYQYSEALSATFLFIVVTTFYYRFFSGNYTVTYTKSQTSPSAWQMRWISTWKCSTSKPISSVTCTAAPASQTCSVMPRPSTGIIPSWRNAPCGGCG